MKTYVTFKTPDALADAAHECADRAREEAVQDNNLSPEDADELYEETKAKVEKVLSKFITSGEYVSIEFDILAGTAKVVSR